MIPTSLKFSLKEEEFGPWVSISKFDPASTLSADPMPFRTLRQEWSTIARVRLAPMLLANRSV
jgi:hypothetical protein